MPPEWLCYNVVDRQWEMLGRGNFIQGVPWVPENRKGRGCCQAADLLERHKCKANYQGSAPSMEVEGVKRIFKRSEQTRKLLHTEYFGDDDSKACQEVQDCYDNIHIETKECVGHVQKRVGTALRKLKKERKQRNLWEG